MTDRKIQLVVPEMTVEQYARCTGVTLRTIEHWIARGYLPSVKIGKRRMVNVAERTFQCAEEANYA